MGELGTEVAFAVMRGWTRDCVWRASVESLRSNSLVVGSWGGKINWFSCSLQSKMVPEVPSRQTGADSKGQLPLDMRCQAES